LLPWGWLLQFGTIQSPPDTVLLENQAALLCSWFRRIPSNAVLSVYQREPRVSRGKILEKMGLKSNAKANQVAPREYVPA
jgi:hypothetical protein